MCERVGPDLGEVASDAVVVGGGDRADVLRDDLQLLQGHPLTTTQRQLSTHTHTHTRLLRASVWKSLNPFLCVCVCVLYPFL